MAAVGLEEIYPIAVGSLALCGLGLGTKILLEQKPSGRSMSRTDVGAKVRAMGSTRV